MFSKTKIFHFKNQFNLTSPDNGIDYFDFKCHFFLKKNWKLESFRVKSQLYMPAAEQTFWESLPHTNSASGKSVRASPLDASLPKIRDTP